MSIFLKSKKSNLLKKAITSVALSSSIFASGSHVVSAFNFWDLLCCCRRRRPNINNELLNARLNINDDLNNIDVNNNGDEFLNNSSSVNIDVNYNYEKDDEEGYLNAPPNRNLFETGEARYLDNGKTLSINITKGKLKYLSIHDLDVNNSGGSIDGIENLEIKGNIEKICNLGLSKNPLKAKLKNVKIGRGVESFGGRTFRFCPKLESIECKYIKKIYGGSFSSCQSLTTVKLPKTLEYAHFDNLFINCHCLQSVDMPRFVKKHYGNFDGTFSHCESLKKVELWIPYDNKNKVKRLSAPFWGCHDLESVEINIPDGNLVELHWTFMDCTNLANLSIDHNEVIGYDDLCFRNCHKLGNEILTKLKKLP